MLNMPETDFDPKKHGFHFPNDFINTIASIPFVGTITTRGRCGGMAYASLDYYSAGVPVPQNKSSPPDGALLADYIYKRLLDSFLQRTSLSFASWTQALDHPTLLRGKGVTRMTKEDEFPKLKQQIDAGKEVVLGLIKAGPDDTL
jgi:hypothetical protein